MQYFISPMIHPGRWRWRITEHRSGFGASPSTFLPSHAYHLLTKKYPSLPTWAKTSVLTQSCAVDAMAWAPIFLSCGECYCAPCHGKWNCTSRNLALLVDKHIFDHIVVATAKSAGWSAFKILSLNRSPWHTWTDITEKLWDLCFTSSIPLNQRQKIELALPINTAGSGPDVVLHIWAELRLLLRKMVPASSPDIPVDFLGPALVLQS